MTWPSSSGLDWPVVGQVLFAPVDPGATVPVHSTVTTCPAAVGTVTSCDAGVLARMGAEAPSKMRAANAASGERFMTAPALSEFQPAGFVSLEPERGLRRPEGYPGPRLRSRKKRAAEAAPD